MTRTDILTLSPRLARRALASVITLFLERQPTTASNCQELFRVTAECSMCDKCCRIDFLSPAKLSFASVEKLAGAFYSLCLGLGGEEKAQSPSGAPAGPSLPISDAPSEVQ